jgi:beta-N-acetylhexosaminidase
MFMVGFPGKEPDAGLMELIRDGVSGVILFKRNLGTPVETAALCRRIKLEAGRPIILAVDQEGGRVARLRGPPFTALPPMREIGRANDPALAQQVGRLLAFELRAVGFDWNFAPVLDVDSNPLNPVIGDRSFHQNADAVAQLGVALARGLEAGGVASCGKHFPGHGDTIHDSHINLPKLAHDLERLRRVELVPFRAYAQASLSSLMTAHVVFESVDPGLPATMSARVLQGILRSELGFRGLIVSDDLRMKAIEDHFGFEEAVTVAARAGVDLFLVCEGADVQRRAIEMLTTAVEAGKVPRSRVEEANHRLDLLMGRFARPAEDRFQWLSSEEHQKLALNLPASTVGRDPTAASG